MGVAGAAYGAGPKALKARDTMNDYKPWRGGGVSPQSMAGVRWNLTTHTASLQEPQAWLGPATMGMPIPPTRPTDALPAREVHSRGPAA